MDGQKTRSELLAGLDTLCIFRSLLRDPVISALREFFAAPSAPAYATFVSALYEYGGDMGEHVRALCENDENVYVKAAASDSIVPDYMFEALVSELELLGRIAALTPDALRAELDYDGFLPSFSSSAPDLRELYLHRIDNIGKYGYGIYAEHHMFYLADDGTITAVLHPDRTELSDLIGYERQREIIMNNTRALLNGKPAANILLSGDAGTGKSSTVKAVANALWREGLRIIELRKDQLREIPRVLDELSGNPLKIVLFIDDLSFSGDDDNFGSLKAVLEGSVAARSANVVIYATSNRRHIVKERFSDREGDDIHRNDTMQELVSLSERFGLHITFSKPDKQTYLHIVHRLAQQQGIDIPEDKLDLLAERFALERGNRSARLARQLVDGLLSGKE